jgi:hypothetical protein
MAKPAGLPIPMVNPRGSCRRASGHGVGTMGNESASLLDNVERSLRFHRFTWQMEKHVIKHIIRCTKKTTTMQSSGICIFKFLWGKQ